MIKLSHLDDFGRVLRQCAATTSRTYPQFVNGQMLRIASFAIQDTEKADAGLIAAKLGQVSTRIRAKKTGKRLKKGVREFSSKASLDLYRIVNWRRKRVGLPPVSGKEMSKVARKMRAATLRSTAFIAAGWIPAVRGLAAAVGYGAYAKAPKLSTRLSGQPKGFVVPAGFTLNDNVTCTIGNTALLGVSAARTGMRPGNPLPIAEAGLSSAAYRTMQDMLNHLRGKVQPVLDKFSAKR